MHINKLKMMVQKPSLINPITQTRTKWDDKQLTKFIDAIKQFMQQNKYTKISYSFNELNQMLKCVDIPTQINDKCTYSAKNSFKYTLNKRIRKFGMQTNLHSYRKKQYLVFSII